jgi:hypothetical protein
MEFSRYEGMDRDRYVLRAVTDSVMTEVMRLSGQEYVDMYATKAKAPPARRGLTLRGDRGGGRPGTKEGPRGSPRPG